MKLKLNTIVTASVQEAWWVEVPDGTDLDHENLWAHRSRRRRPVRRCTC